MKTKAQTVAELLKENTALRARLEEAEETLRAIRTGEVDALVIGDQIYSLKNAETPYRLLVESMNEGAATLVADGSVDYANRRMSEMLGTQPSELIGRPLRDFFEPDERATFDELLELGRQSTGTRELRLRRDNPLPLTLQVSCSPFGAPETCAVFVMATDLTEFKRTEEALRRSNRALRTLSFCNQSMAHAKSENELFTSICQVLVDEGGYALAWIGIGDNDPNKTVRCVARAGQDDGYIANAQITWSDTQRGRGPTGTALRTSRLVTCNNMQTHPEFLPWRAEALRHGFASSISLPLDFSNDLPAALTIYAREIDAFNDDEVRLLIELAGDLNYGISSLRTQAEQLKTEAALRASEQEFRSLAEAVPQIVWATRPDGWTIYFNQHWVDYTGLTLEQSYGHGWNTPFHPDDQQRSWVAWQEATRHGAVYSLEARLRRKDGAYRWWLVRGEAQRDAEGKIIKWFGTCTDIHDLKLAEEEIHKLNIGLEERVRERTTQLEMANRELESFSYSVSHDLRAPLRSIDGFSRLLLEEYQDKLDDEGRDHLARVRAASQRMGQLIDDLLQLSRFTRGAIHRGPVDLSLLAQALAEELRTQEPERHVTFSIEPNLIAHADPGLMRAVLQNLLANAWKFTGKQSEAKIEFGCSLVTAATESRANDGETTNGDRRSPPRQETAFWIRDNGVGFDMTYADKLFGAFQRLHAVTDFPGTGIGLATVQRIIHRHGGRVWAESRPGQGATFYFTLPAPNHADPVRQTTTVENHENQKKPEGERPDPPHPATAHD